MVRLYQNPINSQAAQLLAAKYPMCQLRVQLGQSPHLVLKMKKGVRNTEFLLDLLREGTRGNAGERGFFEKKPAKKL